MYLVSVQLSEKVLTELAEWGSRIEPSKSGTDAITFAVTPDIISRTTKPTVCPSGVEFLDSQIAIDG